MHSTKVKEYVLYSKERGLLRGRKKTWRMRHCANTQVIGSCSLYSLWPYSTCTWSWHGSNIRNSSSILLYVHDVGKAAVNLLWSSRWVSLLRNQTVTDHGSAPWGSQVAVNLTARSRVLLLLHPRRNPRINNDCYFHAKTIASGRWRRLSVVNARFMNDLWPHEVQTRSLRSEMSQCSFIHVHLATCICLDVMGDLSHARVGVQDSATFCLLAWNGRGAGNRLQTSPARFRRTQSCICADSTVNVHRHLRIGVHCTCITRACFVALFVKFRSLGKPHISRLYSNYWTTSVFSGAPKVLEALHADVRSWGGLSARSRQAVSPACGQEENLANAMANRGENHTSKDMTLC